jgi:cytochrome c-type biogenesis protein CcmH
MIVFWIICAILVAIALAFVIPPLLQSAGKEPTNTDKEASVAVYRDQISELESDLQNGIISPGQYQRDRDEIERRLLEDVATLVQSSERKGKNLAGGHKLVYAIAFIVPAIAVALYLRIGNPAAMSASTMLARAPVAGSFQPDAPMTQQGIEANVAALARRLQQNPSDVQGWTMLGRSYLTLEKYEEAAESYAKATALKPDDADLWADYAFAMAMANGQRLAGPPQKLIKKALSLDPENPKALELAGSAAFEARNYNEAVMYWQRLLAKSPPDSELAQALLERINKAKSLSGMK